MDDEKQEMKSLRSARRRSPGSARARTFAGRVALALDVGGILEQRQHALLAILGEGVEVEQPIVGGVGST